MIQEAEKIDLQDMKFKTDGMAGIPNARKPRMFEVYNG
jgi:hypothetical protein